MRGEGLGTSPERKNGYRNRREDSRTMTHKSAATSRMMTVADVATYLGVAVKTVYDWQYAGNGPRQLKIGGQIRYRPEDVDAWLDASQR